MSELTYDIGGDAAEFIRSMRQARGSAEDFDAILMHATQSQLSFNAAAKQVIDSQGKFVSASKANIVVERELNSLGVQTTQQIRQQVHQYDALLQIYKQDAFVTAQLTQRKHLLAQSIGMVRGQSRQLQQGMYSLGYIINDAQQFTYGWSEGLRAVSNNIQPLLMMVSPTGTGLGRWIPWLSVAFAGATTAAVLFGNRSKEALDKAGKAAETAAQRIAGSLPAPEALRAFLAVQQELDDLESKLSRGESVLADRLKALREILPELQKRSAGYLDDMEMINKLRSLGIDIANRENENERTKIGLLQEQRDQRTELQSQLRQIAGSAIEEYTRIQLQNEALQKQIDLVKAIGRARQDPQRLGGIGPDFAEQERRMREALYGSVDLVTGREKDTRHGAMAERLHEFPQAVHDEMAKAKEEWRAGLEEMQVDYGAWLTGTVDGLNYLQQTSSMVFSSIAEFSRAAYDLSGHKSFLVAWRALSISEAIINTAVGVTRALRTGNKWEALAIAALGAANVLKIVNTNVGGGGGGSSSASGGYSTGSGSGFYDEWRSGTFGGTTYGAPNAFARGISSNAGYQGASPAAVEDRATMNRLANALEANNAVLRTLEKGIPAHFNRQAFRKADQASSRMAELTSTLR